MIRLLLLLTLFLAGCQRTEPTLFTALDPGTTHVTFANTITETAEQNVMNYEYTYNGGGVAVGGGSQKVAEPLPPLPPIGPLKFNLGRDLIVRGSDLDEQVRTSLTAAQHSRAAIGAYGTSRCHLSCIGVRPFETCPNRCAGFL